MGLSQRAERIWLRALHSTGAEVVPEPFCGKFPSRMCGERCAPKTGFSRYRERRYIVSCESVFVVTAQCRGRKTKSGGTTQPSYSVLM